MQPRDFLVAPSQRPSSTSPHSLEDVYRSLPVEALQSSVSAMSMVAPAAAKSPGGNTAAGSIIPTLPLPLASYPLSHVASFLNDDPSSILPRAQASLKQCGCKVEQTSPSELSCSIRDECAQVKFNVSLWDVSNEPSAPARCLVDIQRVQGCPFLFYDIVGQAFAAPLGSSTGSSRHFRCLSVPKDLAVSSDIHPQCLETVLSLCTGSDVNIKLQALSALANLCCKDSLVRERVVKVHGQDRLSPLLQDADLNVRTQVQRLMSSLVA